MTSDVSGSLRVLHIVPSFHVGGAEQFVCHLMIGLSKSHEVFGAGLHCALNNSVEQRLKAAGIPLRHLDKRPGFDHRMFSSLDRVLVQIKPHIVHTHMAVLRYALPGLLRRKVPVVLHTLNNMAEHETDTFGRMLQRFAFRRSVRPIAVSREVASSVTRLYGLECDVVPNCIPVEEYRGRPADRIRWREAERFAADAILFTCVGRLEPQKNPLMLIESFAALQDRRAHLVMLGEGSLREQVARAVRELRLEDRIHLLGKRNDVRECLAASDVFVLSSNWEGSPLAVMEAMSAGLPVVATAAGGTPELVESGAQGLIVPREDRAAFTNAMQLLLDDPDRRATMGNAGQIRASESFNVDRMVRAYAALYREGLGGSVEPKSHLVQI